MPDRGLVELIAEMHPQALRDDPEHPEDVIS